MWFNNAVIYEFELKEKLDLNLLLSEEHLKPCPPHARFIYGWLEVSPGQMVREVAGASLICMGKEERILPRGVINHALSQRIKALEEQKGQPIKRAEKARLAQELEFELLPKSFCLQKRTMALLDHETKRLIVNTTSTQQASQLMALLRKSIPGIHLAPLALSDNLSSHFTNWLLDAATLPPMIELANHCLLFSPDDENKRFHCKGYDLPAEEIVTLLSSGLAASEVSLAWNQRVEFTLTHDFKFKKVKCMDYLVDEQNDIRDLEDEEQQHDAALVLLASEWRGLLKDLTIPLQENQLLLSETAPAPAEMSLQ